MKRIISIVVLVCLLTGCQASFKYDETFDGNRANQSLAVKHEDYYLVNMTDGIFICSDDFEEAEQLTNEYCFYVYEKDGWIYYIGGDDEGNDRIERQDIKTGNTEWIYSGIAITYFAPYSEGWIVSDNGNIVKLRTDGMKLYETKRDGASFSHFSTDNFLLYTEIYNTETVKMYDFESNKISDVFKTEEGSVAKIICDGVNIYYALHTAGGVYDFCVYDMNEKKNTTLIKTGFSEEFNICDGVCYYSVYENGKSYLKKFDIASGEETLLKETEWDIKDINIIDNKLFYRVISHGKQIEVLDLEDNSTIYLYEKYADITKRVP